MLNCSGDWFAYLTKLYNLITLKTQRTEQLRNADEIIKSSL